MPENQQSGTVVINPSGVAEQYASEDAQKLLQQGYQVPLIDSQGNPVSATYEEAQRLVREGSHAQPQTAHLQELLKTAHYNSPKQQAIAFIEGALDANSLGLSNKLLADTGITTNEDILARKEYHPGTRAMGEVAGTVAGMVLAPEASIPGIISKAGKAASAAIKAEGTFGRLAQVATKNAIEGGLLSAQHEIGEHLIDPHSTAEQMVGNIGMGAALSGVFGMALSPIAKGADKAIDFLKNPALAKGLIDRGTDLVVKSGADAVMRGVGIPGIAREYIKDNISKQLQSPYTQGALNTLLHVSELAAKSTKQIEKYAGGIFGSTASTLLNDKPRDKKVFDDEKPHIDNKKLNKMKGLMEVYMTNPESLIDNLNNNLAPINDYAPQLAQAITMTVGNAVNFLQSKIPTQEQGGAFDALPQLSNSDISKFNRYVKVADQPTYVLERIKEGNLLMQDVEALATIYPGLYGNMKEVLTKKLVDYKSKKNPAPLPYKTVINLSMFLGEPLVNSLKPMNLMDNQMAFEVMDQQNQMEQSQQMNAKASKSGMGKIKSFERDQTIAQRAAMRKSV